MACRAAGRCRHGSAVAGHHAPLFERATDASELRAARAASSATLHQAWTSFRDGIGDSPVDRRNADLFERIGILQTRYTRRSAELSARTTRAEANPWGNPEGDEVDEPVLDPEFEAEQLRDSSLGRPDPAYLIRQAIRWPSEIGLIAMRVAVAALVSGSLALLLGFDHTYWGGSPSPRWCCIRAEAGMPRLCAASSGWSARSAASRSMLCCCCGARAGSSREPVRQQRGPQESPSPLLRTAGDGTEPGPGPRGRPGSGEPLSRNVDQVATLGYLVLGACWHPQVRKAREAFGRAVGPLQAITAHPLTKPRAADEIEADVLAVQRVITDWR